MRIIVPILYTVFYLAIIMVNTLSNTLPLNNQTTGELSNKYDSMITPAGFAFSIWSIIYLLLGIFIIKVWKEYKTNGDYSVPLLPLFIFQSLMNMAWLFAWHYEKIALSVIIMLFLLISIILIYKYVTIKELWRIPWSIYLGWISVASIVNISVLILHYNINFFVDYATVYTLVMTIIAFVLGIYFLQKENDVYYPLVISWALFFIGIANVDRNNFTYFFWLGSAILLSSSVYKFRKRLKSK